MKSEEQDRHLIERTKVGEIRAFQVLIEKYKDDAFSLACSIVKDPVLAEDILQEVFLKVFDKVKSFKFQSTFYTWLYRIVVNQCYNELRKNKFTQPEPLETISGKEEAAALASSNDIRKIINFSLNQMKPDEALVLRLFYLSELRMEEVEQVTGFSKSKVKVTLHRGRKSLAEILKKQLGKEIEDL